MNEGNFKFEFSVTEISHHKRGKQIYFLRTILFFEWTNFIFISNQKIKEKRFIFVSPLVLSRLKKEKKTWGGNSGTHRLRWLGLSRGGVVVWGGGRREALSLDLPTKTPEVCLCFLLQHAACSSRPVLRLFAGRLLGRGTALIASSCLHVPPSEGTG